jgi:hypothetical protein
MPRETRHYQTDSGSAPPSECGRSKAQRDSEENDMTTLDSIVVAEHENNPPGTGEKLRTLRAMEAQQRTALLCTSYLPPVTHSLTALLRYARQFGTTPESLQVVREKLARERALWQLHISRSKRYDIIDRQALVEYLQAPEYYQMPLTREELEEQAANVLQLLENPNYELCLTPRTVNIAFEVRGEQLQIRTDRRNKGEPRLGQVNHLVIAEPGVAESFQQEFWSLYRATEPEFRSKAHIKEWLGTRVSGYRGPESATPADADTFDVFLCHNSSDKRQVMAVGERLLDQGVRVWLDQWNLRPGLPWVRALEQEVGTAKAAAVFVGENGVGPWMQMEIEALLREFVRRGCPVIPVVLPTAQTRPPLPKFLEGMHWVDFRAGDPDPFAQLVWGITGRAPRRRTGARPQPATGSAFT